MPAYTHLDDDYAALRLGARIREERKRKGWTLAELAARLSLSIGTLSAVENQKLPVHVDLLFALSTVLGVGVDVLVPRSTTLHFHIARRGQMESQPALPLKVVNLATESLLSYHNRLWPLAKPFVGKHLEPFEIDVQPISDDKLRFISHNHEEFVFVLRGRIQCLIKTPDGLTDARLGPGDCIYFWSYLPHCIRSVDREAARTIHVDYSPQAMADAEYSNNGSGPAIYLIDAGQEDPAGQIAGQIVALRKASGMSTAHLARQIGVSARRLKQIESARKPISLELLLRICSAFQKPTEYFLVHSVVERPFSHVLRARDIRRPGGRGQTGRRGCSAEGTFTPLADGFPKHGMQPFLVRLDRTRQPPRAVRHAGQEFVYVLRGAVRFTTKRDRQVVDEVLLPGDACFLDSSVPHAFTETRVTPYEAPGADMLLVRWARVPRSDAARGVGG
ncbi:MAG: helix-turn-helix domain-containing protein [Vicinamibacterales bacterium]